MTVSDRLNGLLRHSMRAYYLPMTAGVVLAGSAFMPWLNMGDQSLGGVPELAGLWVLGLGIVAVTLAVLSVVTRKNSRHPLLLVGLASFGVLLLGEQLMERAVVQQAWARSQALAIVEGGTAATVPDPTMAVGTYLGLAASSVIALFGLTIVVKRVPKVYAEPEDDDA